MISVFSCAYTDAPADTWSVEGDAGQVVDSQIAWDSEKPITNLVCDGIEFASSSIDVTSMTRLRVDFRTPDLIVSPVKLKVTLVHLGADDLFGKGNDIEQEITFSSTCSMALDAESFVVLDITLAQLTRWMTSGHLSQLVLSGELGVVFVDHQIFHK